VKKSSGVVSEFEATDEEIAKVRPAKLTRGKEGRSNSRVFRSKRVEVAVPVGRGSHSEHSLGTITRDGVRDEA